MYRKKGTVFAHPHIEVGANAGRRQSSRRTVLLAGATGLTGSHLSRRLLARGDRLLVWSRDTCRARDLFGPDIETIESLESIERWRRIDVVVNLAGAPLLQRPWTRQRRRELIASRVTASAALRRLIARVEVKPELLVNASATCYYGASGDEEVLETGLPGPGFQSDLCVRWESESRRVENYGVRVVRARLGLVLGRGGGVLPAVARAFGYGAGAVLGSGRQWVSWVHVEDAARLCEFAIDTPSLQGAVNVTAPRPVTQATLARAIAARSKMPLLLRIPALPIRIALGEMAELLVDGQCVLPARALQNGFSFNYPSLDAALANLLPSAHGAGARNAGRSVPGKTYRNA